MSVNKNRLLKLILITPAGQAEPVICDSIRFCVSDDQRGLGGGSYGIHRGHPDSIFSLSSGPVEAFLEGESVLCEEAQPGFALLRDDTLTVVVGGMFHQEEAEASV